jgi:hypothetical protein
LKVIAVDPGITSLRLRDGFRSGWLYDDDVLDDDPSVDAGRFEDLFTSFFMKPARRNTGTWVPGSLDLTASSSVTDAVANTLTFTLRGSGFPDGGDASLPFFDIVLEFEYLGRFMQGAPDVTDSGLGDTFAEQFNHGPPGCTPVPPLPQSCAASRLVSGHIRFGRDESDLSRATLKNAPEPGLPCLLAGALLGGALSARRGARPRC